MLSTRPLSWRQYTIDATLGDRFRPVWSLTAVIIVIITTVLGLGSGPDELSIKLSLLA
jgi:hypothetical protein